MTLLEAGDNSVLDVLSVGMQNSALVLKDEDGTSVTDLAEFSNSNESGLTPAAINIENSSDVIIGPVTQFHGPVSIYQNVNGSPTPTEREPIENGQNGKLVKSDSTSSDGPHPADKSSKTRPPFKHLKYVGIFLLVLVIVGVITTVAILFSSKSESLIKPEPSDYTDNGVTVTVNPGPGPGALIDKQLWGGYPPRNSTPLRHPTPLVIISHTATPMCTDFISCIKRVQNIQSYHVGTLRYDDISYSFLIGGDGNAYVGRGWDVQTAQRNNSIGICFIGNYIFHKATPEMIDVAQKLIKEGVKAGKLAENYKLIGHNQTFKTESPGVNLYSEIKTWPHFDSRLYFEPPKKVGGS